MDMYLQIYITYYVHGTLGHLYYITVPCEMFKVLVLYISYLPYCQSQFCFVDVFFTELCVDI